jgi:hypothetical protein
MTTLLRHRQRIITRLTRPGQPWIKPNLPLGAYTPPPPGALQIDAAGPYTINGRVGDSTTLAGTSAEGTPPITFAWTDTGAGDLTFSSRTVLMPVVTYAGSPVPGLRNYTLTLTATDALGPKTDTALFTVNVPPLAADLSVDAGGPYNSPAGDPLTVSAVAAGGTPPYSYLWSVSPAGAGAVLETPTSAFCVVHFSGLPPGVFNYMLTVQVTDSLGARVRRTLSMQMKTTHWPPGVDGGKGTRG